LTKGLQFQSNYTWSKTIDSNQFLNDTDAQFHKLISDLDRTHRLTINAVYELPFGRGKAFGSGANAIVNHLIGGWQVSAIFNAQSGPPLAFGNVIYSGSLSDISLSGDQQSLARWFNTDGFNRNSAQQLAWNIRTFPLRIAQARGDGINMWDFGLFKSITLREGIRLQIRCEAEGAMNHTNFAAPNTTPTSSLFGQVTATQTNQEERRIFAGLKLIL
jgi:hypothetical protein